MLKKKLKKKNHHLMEDLAKSGYRNQITVPKTFSHPSIFFLAIHRKLTMEIW
jgi:hypothetical protein